MALKSSSLDASWYRRHRDPERRVHQKEVRGLPNSGVAESQAVSIEERKAAIKARIARLKDQKEKKPLNRFVETTV